MLYDFTADGEDELTVREGETLMVLERDGDEWWKCRNQDGLVGVVPASYVEVSLDILSVSCVDQELSQLVPDASGKVPPKVDPAAALAAQAAAARAAQQEKDAERERELAEKDRADKERKAEAEERAKAAAASAEADRRRREQERERKEKERAAATAAAAEEETKRKRKEKEKERERQSQDGPKSPRKSGESRGSTDKRKSSHLFFSHYLYRGKRLIYFIRRR